MNGSRGLAAGQLLWTSSRLASLSSCQTRLSKGSRPTPLSVFLAVSPRLFGWHHLAAGRDQSAGFRADPLAYFLRVSLSCLWICSAQLVSCGLSISLGSGRFISTSLMCASSMCQAGSSYMISGWLISHSFRPVYPSKFRSFLSWFVLGQLTSAMSLRSASPVCATGSSRMAPGQLLWDVVLQIPFSWRRIGPSL